jgi:hypothetical protein
MKLRHGTDQQRVQTERHIAAKFHAEKGMIFEQSLSHTLKQCLCFTGLQACHSWIHQMNFAGVEASFPALAGAWLDLLRGETN